jgi:spermidine/putrescine transport system ATP-binding protein
MVEPIIELRDVVKRHGAITAVCRVSFSIEAGAFVSIIGSSGSGKTTTLRLIAGLEHADEGQVVVAGRDMRNVAPWESETPLVWQNFVLFPHLSVADNVAFGLRMRRMDAKSRRRKAERALDAVGLGGFQNRSVGTLSGGQMQRVGLARALVLEPRVLLLDEPLGALDPPTARQMQTELKRLHAELGITFVYVTHNQPEASALSDQIIVMDQGVVHQIATPYELEHRPRDRFVARFVGDNAIIEGTVLSLTAKGALVRTPDGDIAAVRGDCRIPDVDAKVAVAIAASAIRLSEAGAPALSGSIETIEMTSGIGRMTIKTRAGTLFGAVVTRRDIEQCNACVGHTIQFRWADDAPTIISNN